MSNFLTDNPDLLFTLKNLDLREVVSLFEKDYTECKKFDIAPENYDDAIDGYQQVLEVIGEITGERIAGRSRQVDEEGPKFENNTVTYHPLTVQNLEVVSVDAERNLLLVKGAVPGPNNGLLIIRDTVKA